MHKLFGGFAAVFYKECLHIRRDSTAMAFALLMPLMQMALLGFAIDTNVRKVPTVVLNQDGREPSRDFLARLQNSDTFDLRNSVTNDNALHEEIVSGRARVAIKIPPDYSDRLLKRDGAQVLVLIDGSDSSVTGQAMNVSTSIGLDESLRYALAGKNDKLALEVRPQVLFNPDSRSPNFFLPGLIAILMLSVTTFLTAFSIVREKEQGTLEQLFVTPVRPLGMLLGKILPFLLIGFVELCVLLLAMVMVFQVPVNGSISALLLLSLPYLFVVLAFGTLISTKANSQSEAMQMSFMVFIPAIFLSGYVFPRETMPTFFQWMSYAVPATYYIDIMRGIILRGAGYRHLWPQAMALTVMGIVMLVIAAKKFQSKVITK
jgi:ABC-2 type transport system permease protein